MIKRLITSGGSKAINLPKAWLDFCKAEAGQEIEAVAIEVDGQLTIRPYIPPKQAGEAA
jgi:antitoxin component of MazEF toxin-antitoxin module